MQIISRCVLFRCNMPEWSAEKLCENGNKSANKNLDANFIKSKTC